MNKIITLSIFLLVIGWQQGWSQPMRKWIRSADTAFQRGDYYQAFKYYEIALDYPKPPADLQFKLAQSARLFNAFPSAEEAYQQVIVGPDSTHHAEATFYLASVQHSQAKYQEALLNYQLFLDRYVPEAPQLEDNARNGVRDCNWALQRRDFAIKSGKASEDTLYRFKANVNTIFSEFGPNLRGDTLYYSSLSQYTNDSTRLYSQVWRSVNEAPAERLPDGFNAKDLHTGNTSFSDDGNTVYFTRCKYLKNGRIHCDLFVSQRLGGSWTEPKMLSVNKEGYSSTQPSLGFDQKTGEYRLYFASNRPGPGDRHHSADSLDYDLYYSVAGPDRQFGEPVYLAAINTPGNETTPFFHTATQELYFSSNYYTGLGGLDIFRTRPQGGSGWQIPIHLAAPVNSSYDDAYYFLNPEGSKAVFSSSRYEPETVEPEKEACCFDLYTLKYDLRVELLASVMDSCDQSRAISDAEILLYELPVNGEPGLVEATKGPSLEASIRRLTDYRLVARGEDGQETSKTFRVDTIPDSGLIKQELLLTTLPDSVDLIVQVFEQSDEPQNNQKEPTALSGARVSLKRAEANGDLVLIDEKLLPGTNQYVFRVARNQDYQIEADYPLSTYSPSSEPITFKVETGECENSLVRRVFLYNQPIELYFDNDEPGPKTYISATRAKYDETYNKYYQRKEEFIRQNERILTPEKFFVERINLDNFFERDVKREGFDRLKSLIGQIGSYLDEGLTVQLELFGYASPLGNARYNTFLSHRRINSVKNFLFALGGESLRNRINQIEFVERAFGEPENTRAAIDRAGNRTADVFGLEASLLRRVTIYKVNIKLQTAPALSSSDR